jgi:hypothetical protein
VTFGSSSKTSDFSVDTLGAWWQGLNTTEQGTIARIPIKMDNGSESSGVRTQFLHRLVQCVDTMGKPIQLLSYPLYPSKDKPIERCWGGMEVHWNGTPLIDMETMLEWAKRMPWQGMHPIVKLSRKMYAKGVSLSKAAMRAVEARLDRNPLWPKWAILIRPAGVD